MANTYHKIYLHVIFAVKYRTASIESFMKQSLYNVIGNLIKECNCKSIIINGVEDHLHCLLALKPTICVSDLMKVVKAKSSKYINDRKLTPHKFEWQSGYGAFSVSHKQMQWIFKYIQFQEEHHHIKTFKEEYLEILKEHKIDFEEKYLFQALI